MFERKTRLRDARNTFAWWGCCSIPSRSW